MVGVWGWKGGGVQVCACLCWYACVNVGVCVCVLAHREGVEHCPGMFGVSFSPAHLYCNRAWS